MRGDELSFVRVLNDAQRKVLSSSERIMRLVPALILETRNQKNYKVFAQVTAAALAQSVERLTAEREVAGSIRGLTENWELRIEGTALTAGPSRGSDDHVKWRSRHR